MMFIMFVITTAYHPAVILSTARIVNVQIEAYDLVLRSAALFQLLQSRSNVEMSPLEVSTLSVQVANLCKQMRGGLKAPIVGHHLSP